MVMVSETVMVVVTEKMMVTVTIVAKALGGQRYPCPA